VRLIAISLAVEKQFVPDRSTVRPANCSIWCQSSSYRFRCRQHCMASCHQWRGSDTV